MITIDFEDVFEPIDVAEDLSFMTFNSFIKSNGYVNIKINITPLLEPLLPNVYNLSFGPYSKNGEIDDFAKINHSDKNKVFSTILLYALTFLQANNEITIGIDGSDDIRAYLYHRMFKSNKEYLADYFMAIGVDWYLRLLRNDQIELDVSGSPFFKPKPEPFNYNRASIDLYRYYMFHLKK